MNAQLAKLSVEADESRQAAERMRRDLEESRDNYAKLAVSHAPTHSVLLSIGLLLLYDLVSCAAAAVLPAGVNVTTHPTRSRRTPHRCRRQTRASRSWR